MHKILLDLEIQTGHLILARKRDQVLINKKKKEKKTYHRVDFTVPTDLRVKMKEKETIDKYLDLTGELKKSIKHEGDGDTNSSWCTWNGSKRFRKTSEGTGNQRKNRNHPGNNIDKIG